jgi:hypothetical protein
MSCDISKSALHRHRQHLPALGRAEPAQILSAVMAPTVAAILWNHLPKLPPVRLAPALGSFACA